MTTFKAKTPKPLQKIKCVVCGKDILCGTPVPEVPVTMAKWYSGMVGVMTAEYKSWYETGRFLVGICDWCVGLKYTEGVIRKINGDHVGPVPGKASDEDLEFVNPKTPPEPGWYVVERGYANDD